MSITFGDTPQDGTERRERALRLVGMERATQLAAFGLDTNLHHRLVVLMEEVGELARAVLELDAAAVEVQRARERVLEEAVQVAAVAVSIAEVA
ncbi:MAG TPA: hypothetical protein PLS95_01135 [Thermoanaerobaculales bacterium]|jgi:NTP pyrophosphatase (non-canonical NTP hydrolase)|nr:hypothetical protein [Thermoanaerobaculales bacterium]